MGRSVLLLHELPDGGRHYDWLIERDGAPGAELVAFRVTERIDSLAPPLPTPRGEAVGCFEATRIADHRREYLEHEGPVSGGRGTVRRVARGQLRVEIDGPAAFRARGNLGDATGVFDGVVQAGAVWAFRFVAAGG